MKKEWIYIIIVIAQLMGCKKMTDFQDNPNDPTTGSPSSFLTRVERDLFADLLAYDGASVASRYFVGFNFHGETNQYYRWTTGSFNKYSVIRNVREMEKWAGENDNYIALAKLFRSIFFYDLTMRFGDIPYSEAMQLTEKIATPKYDTQKDIFLGILNELEAANDIFAASNATINGDFIYNGNILKWRKFTNSFAIRVLLALSHQENDADLQTKSRFAAIMNNPAKYPLFESNADNAQRIGNTLAPHPFFSDQAYLVYVGMERDFINMLKERNDPRIRYYAEMTSGAKEGGLQPTDMNAYNGLPGSAPNQENSANILLASVPKTDYFYRENFEPVLYLGYYEINFLIAEAITRGWWSGESAATYYNKGIEASMLYWGIAQDEIDDYLQQPLVAFDPSQALSRILIQKYLANNLNSGWESFFTQRRTGIPVFDVSGAGVINNRIAYRWNYPESEYLLNGDNVREAVARQYPDGDNIYSKMWILK